MSSSHACTVAFQLSFSFLVKTSQASPTSAMLFGLAASSSVKHTSLFTLFSRYPCRHAPFKPTATTSITPKKFQMRTFSSLSSSNSTSQASQPSSTTPSNKSKKKARRESPEGLLRYGLDMCSKHGDLVKAIRLYDEAREKGVALNQHHYNVLLYICSSPTAQDLKDLAVKRGFEIFEQMGIDKIPPNEATFTATARLAASKEDPDMAFDLVKKMKSSGIVPRLRSYGPALFGFCSKGEVDKAYEVDVYMVGNGVSPEEAELAALLKVSVDSERGEKVYEFLHRLRASVRQVLDSTAKVAEEWFSSEAGAEVGVEDWDVGKVRDGIFAGGGGWHGQGWLGKGKWSVVRTAVDARGVCNACGDKLVTIDIDPLETENFAKSLASFACQREVRANFTSFQEWLDRNGPFDAVIDGANVGLFNQHDFSFFQLNSVVNGVRQMSPSKKLPLVILHSRRVKGGPTDKVNNKKLIESWRRSGVLYTTPAGSNDDWYWLYAAVSCKSLLVTNDEMRDHLFELLGTSFFPRWKERHQVRLTVSKSGPMFHMPPPYSIVIQESEGGSWHIPTVIGDDIETPREWVCATRASPHPVQTEICFSQHDL